MTAPSLAPTPGSVRVYTLGDPEFRAISKIAREEAGLNLSDSKQSLVYSRLVNRLRLLGIEDFRAYVRLLKSEDGAAEMGYLISALTTNVTAFFRECHHFAHLQADVAPVLAITELHDSVEHEYAPVDRVVKDQAFLKWSPVAMNDLGYAKTVIHVTVPTP